MLTSRNWLQAGDERLKSITLLLEMEAARGELLSLPGFPAQRPRTEGNALSNGLEEDRPSNLEVQPVLLVPGNLNVQVFAAHKLKNTDTNLFGDLSDPYVIVRVGKQEFKTEVIKNNLDPTWENADFHIRFSEDDDVVELEVWNSNVRADDCLGKVQLDFRTLQPGSKLRRREVLQQGDGAELEFDVLFAPDAAPPAAGAPGDDDGSKKGDEDSEDDEPDPRLHGGVAIDSLFELVDVDRNQVLSKEELGSLFRAVKHGSPISPEMLDAVMTAADTNGDGSIDRKEFLGLMHKWLGPPRATRYRMIIATLSEAATLRYMLQWAQPPVGLAVTTAEGLVLNSSLGRETQQRRARQQAMGASDALSPTDYQRWRNTLLPLTKALRGQLFFHPWELAQMLKALQHTDVADRRVFFTALLPCYQHLEFRKWEYSTLARLLTLRSEASVLECRGLLLRLDGLMREQRMDIAGFWKKYDKDHSQRIDRLEMQAALRESIVASGLQTLTVDIGDSAAPVADDAPLGRLAAQVVTLMDVDVDGQVSMMEFADYMMSLRGDASSSGPQQLVPLELPEIPAEHFSYLRVLPPMLSGPRVGRLLGPEGADHSSGSVAGPCLELAAEAPRPCFAAPQLSVPFVGAQQEKLEDDELARRIWGKDYKVYQDILGKTGGGGDKWCWQVTFQHELDPAGAAPGAPPEKPRFQVGVARLGFGADHVHTALGQDSCSWGVDFMAQTKCHAGRLKSFPVVAIGGKEYDVKVRGVTVYQSQAMRERNNEGRPEGGGLRLGDVVTVLVDLGSSNRPASLAYQVNAGPRIVAYEGSSFRVQDGVFPCIVLSPHFSAACNFGEMELENYAALQQEGFRPLLLELWKANHQRYSYWIPPPDSPLSFSMPTPPGGYRPSYGNGTTGPVETFTVPAQLFDCAGMSAMPGGDARGLRVYAASGASRAVWAFDGFGRRSLAAAAVDPRGVAVHPDGWVALADMAQGVILGLCDVDTPSCRASCGVIAGTPFQQGLRDGPARSAQFHTPNGLAVHPDSGDIFVSDTSAAVIRRISGLRTSSVEVSTDFGKAYDRRVVNGWGRSARLHSPAGLCCDIKGQYLYVVEQEQHCLRRVQLGGQLAGSITTVAGLPGTPGSADGLKSVATFTDIAEICCDMAGQLLVTDAGGLRLVLPDAKDKEEAVRTLKGNQEDNFASSAHPPYAIEWRRGMAGTVAPACAEASFHCLLPSPVAPRLVGYRSDPMRCSPRLLFERAPTELKPADRAAAVASPGATPPAASLSVPRSLERVCARLEEATFEGFGPTCVHHIEHIEGKGLLVVGDHTVLWQKDGYCWPAITEATTSISSTCQHPGDADGSPRISLLADAQRVVYTVPTEDDAVPTLDSSLSRFTFDGSDLRGHRDGPLEIAIFDSPAALCADDDDALFIADSGSATIRHVSKDGMVRTIAGCPYQRGFVDGPLGMGLLDRPCAVTMAAGKRLLIADFAAHCVRMVHLDSLELSTVFGVPESPGPHDGVASYSARVAQMREVVRNPLLRAPAHLFADGKDGLLIADDVGVRLAELDTGRLTTICRDSGPLCLVGDDALAVVVQKEGKPWLKVGSEWMWDRIGQVYGAVVDKDAKMHGGKQADGLQEAQPEVVMCDEGSENSGNMLIVAGMGSLTLTLPRPACAKKIVLYFPDAKRGVFCPEFAVFGSNDGQAWDEIHHEDSYKPPARDRPWTFMVENIVQAYTMFRLDVHRIAMFDFEQGEGREVAYGEEGNEQPEEDEQKVCKVKLKLHVLQRGLGDVSTDFVMPRRILSDSAEPRRLFDDNAQEPFVIQPQEAGHVIVEMPTPLYVTDCVLLSPANIEAAPKAWHLKGAPLRADGQPPQSPDEWVSLGSVADGELVLGAHPLRVLVNARQAFTWFMLEITDRGQRSSAEPRVVMLSEWRLRGGPEPSPLPRGPRRLRNPPAGGIQSSLSGAFIFSDWDQREAVVMPKGIWWINLSYGRDQYLAKYALTVGEGPKGTDKAITALKPGTLAWRVHGRPLGSSRWRLLDVRELGAAGGRAEFGVWAQEPSAFLRLEFYVKEDAYVGPFWPYFTPSRCRLPRHPARCLDPPAPPSHQLPPTLDCGWGARTPLAHGSLASQKVTKAVAVNGGLVVLRGEPGRQDLVLLHGLPTLQDERNIISGGRVLSMCTSPTYPEHIVVLMKQGLFLAALDGREDALQRCLWAWEGLPTGQRDGPLETALVEQALHVCCDGAGRLVLADLDADGRTAVRLLEAATGAEQPGPSLRTLAIANTAISDMCCGPEGWVYLLAGEELLAANVETGSVEPARQRVLPLPPAPLPDVALRPPPGLHCDVWGRVSGSGGAVSSHAPGRGAPPLLGWWQDSGVLLLYDDAGVTEVPKPPMPVHVPVAVEPGNNGILSNVASVAGSGFQAVRSCITGGGPLPPEQLWPTPPPDAPHTGKVWPSTPQPRAQPPPPLPKSWPSKDERLAEFKRAAMLAGGSGRGAGAEPSLSGVHLAAAACKFAGDGGGPPATPRQRALGGGATLGPEPGLQSVPLRAVELTMEGGRPARGVRVVPPEAADELAAKHFRLSSGPGPLARVAAEVPLTFQADTSHAWAGTKVQAAFELDFGVAVVIDRYSVQNANVWFATRSQDDIAFSNDPVHWRLVAVTDAGESIVEERHAKWTRRGEQRESVLLCNAAAAQRYRLELLQTHRPATGRLHLQGVSFACHKASDPPPPPADPALMQLPGRKELLGSWPKQRQPFLLDSFEPDEEAELWHCRAQRMLYAVEIQMCAVHCPTAKTPPLVDKKKKALSQCVAALEAALRSKDEVALRAAVAQGEQLEERAVVELRIYCSARVDRVEFVMQDNSVEAFGLRSTRAPHVLPLGAREWLVACSGVSAGPAKHLRQIRFETTAGRVHGPFPQQLEPQDDDEAFAFKVASPGLGITQLEGDASSQPCRAPTGVRQNLHFLATTVQCPGKHALARKELRVWEDRFSRSCLCDLCGRKIVRREPRFRCEICTYNVCHTCSVGSTAE